MVRLEERCDLLRNELSKRMRGSEAKLAVELEKKRTEMKEIFNKLTVQQSYYESSNEAIKVCRVDCGVALEKIQIFQKLANEFHKNIEGLKTHSLVTDLHLEAYLPIQVASIAYDVSSGAVVKKNYPKFRQNFRKKLKVLEQNLMGCCDPEPDKRLKPHISLFQKNQYELPHEYLNPTKDMLKRDDSKDEGISVQKSKKGTHSREKRRLSKMSNFEPNF